MSRRQVLDRAPRIVIVNMTIGAFFIAYYRPWATHPRGGLGRSASRIHHERQDKRQEPVMKILSAVQLSLSCAAVVVSLTATAVAGTGFLEAQQRQYTPQGCTQNGNTSVCKFTVVNRGKPLTLHAWPGDLRTLQLVDGSHVPHAATRGYFVDSSGNHQTQLVLQSGDQCLIVVEFPNSNVNDATAEFHLHSQIVGGAADSDLGAAAFAADAPTGSIGDSSAATAFATPAAAVAPGTLPAACASNVKSAACRAAEAEERVCTKSPSSAACRQAAARAQKLEAAGK